MTQRYERNLSNRDFRLQSGDADERWRENRSRSYRESARDEAGGRNQGGLHRDSADDDYRWGRGHERYPDQPQRMWRPGQVGHYGPGPAASEPWAEPLPPDAEWYGWSGEPRAQERLSESRQSGRFRGDDQDRGYPGSRRFAVDWSPFRGEDTRSVGRAATYPDERGGGERGGEHGAPQRGRFSGKGPKGYTRSDQRIHEDVCERLSDDDEVDASDISVSVQNGEVTLDGTVPDRRSKHRAEDIAESVGGVKDVHNSLRTQKGFLEEMGERITGRDRDDMRGHSGSGTREMPGAH